MIGLNIITLANEADGNDASVAAGDVSSVTFRALRTLSEEECNKTSAPAPAPSHVLHSFRYLRCPSVAKLPVRNPSGRDA
jgi:hypothetical protein